MVKFLFLISFIAVFVSSYLTAAVFERKRAGICFLYTGLIAFAQVVLSFEVMSLLNAISWQGTLFLNAAFLTGAILFWIKNAKPIVKPDLRRFFTRILHALKKDKFLMLMALGFIFFVAVAVILCILIPVTSFDAMSYHLNRVPFWISQGSLNHFDIADDRNTVMPINSEILYMWIMVFLKADIGLTFVSFAGFLFSIVSLYNILTLFGFCERKKLWSVFILSSFASVIAEASSYETDIVIGGLVLCGIFLYLQAIKEHKLSMIYFSSLAFGLAFGTKTPALIAFPACFLLLVYFSILRREKEAFKPIVAFCGLLTLNFLIFSSYNYFLNLINYGNIFATDSSRIVHGFWGGPKAYIANFIRYVFMLFDFSGFRYSEYVGQYINSAKFALFALLNIDPNLGVTMTDGNVVNNKLLDPVIGGGILGFLVFLPCSVFCLIAAFFKNKPLKYTCLIPFGFLFWLNLLVMSGTLGYMVFSVRFVSFFMIISSPILAVSYMKKGNFVKIIILFFSLSYLLLISTHLPSRSIKHALRVYREEGKILKARERISCTIFNGYYGKMPFCTVKDYIKNMPKNSRIGIFPMSDTRSYQLKMLDFEGYKTDFLLFENIDKYNLKDYDYIVLTDPYQVSTVVYHPENAYKNNYTVVKDKVVFKNDTPVKCFYVSNSRVPITGNDKSIPVQSVCYTKENFFEDNGFKLNKIFMFKSAHNENRNTVTIYERK